MPAPAKLRIIATPEQDLAALFQRERQLERDLASTRADIANARAAYASKHGLRANPRVETLRQMFGGEA